MNELFESSCLSVISEENDKLRKEIERLNNDIKVLLKENENKERVIKAQDNIIKEVREYIEKSKSKLPLGINDFTCEMVYSDEVVLANELLEILDKENNNEDN